MRGKLTATIAVALSFWAGRAQAISQAPHDAASGVTCNSCHVPFAGLTDAGHLVESSATGGSTTSAADSTKTWAPGVWAGATIVFTSGANIGKFRTVAGNTATGVSWSIDNPLGAAVAAGDGYKLYKFNYSDVEVKCKVCHTVGGLAGDHPGGALHFTGATSMGCGKCHEPHNVKANSGWVAGPGGGYLIRDSIKLPNGQLGAVAYDPANPLTSRFTTAAGDGVCQVCHTQLEHWTNDGAGQDHHVGEDCSAAGCHDHDTSFNTAMTGDHFLASSPAWAAYPARDPCYRCHTTGGFQDYTGADGSADNHLDGSFRTNLTATGAFAPGPMVCTTCHNAVTDPATGTLTSVRFVSWKQVNSLDRPTALCSQCHQGREATLTVNAVIANNTTVKGVAATSDSANAAGTTTTLVKTSATWPINAWVGRTIHFTKGAAIGLTATVTANDATSVTFTPALAAATVSGDAFTVYPAATGGTTSTLVDANGGWTDNAFAGAYLYMQTGASAGLYRKIKANTATTLTFGDGTKYYIPFQTAVAAGDQYQIVLNDATTLDTLLPTTVGFLNPHYLGAGAILQGQDAAMAFQYPTNYYSNYVGRNFHAISQGKCVDCHDEHTLHVEVSADTCGGCHFKADGSPVANLTELEEERQYGFEGDIDGDGNAAESLKVEIDGLGATLYAAIQAYGRDVSGTRICYYNAHPYFFIDTNADGACDAGEAVSANKYNKFTPRLLRATFNYKWYLAEPGAWAHNPKYAIEFLFDSITDLNTGLVAKGFTAVAFAGYRTFWGHFGGAAVGWPAGYKQFRYWDSDNPQGSSSTNGLVSNSCALCHGGKVGFDNYQANPMNSTNVRPVQGMECTVCHAPTESSTDMTELRAIASVRFPPRPPTGVSPVVVDATGFAYANGPKDMICSTCHAGRESSVTVDAAIGTKPETDWTISFKNIHYFAAAASLLGSTAGVGYEFPLKTYAGADQHHGVQASCVECHSPQVTRHTFEVAEATSICTTCHTDALYEGYKAAARAGVDYDGNTAVEDLHLELEGMADRLLIAIQAYGTANAHPVCYNGASHPYFFVDGNGNGVCDAGETTGATMNSTMLKAAFNYQMEHKDPGGWAHNFDYLAQLMYDSIESLGGSTTGLVRP